MKSRGFTLIEVMISLFIGGLILGGVMFTYVSMKLTTKDTMVIGELQESGRLALNIMQRDIEQVGFWGTYYDDSFTTSNTRIASELPGSDCYEGLNNHSFPDLTSSSNFRAIYAKQAMSSRQLNCITDATKNTDILQIKFLQGDPQYNAASGKNDTIATVNYFVAEQENAQFVTGAYTPTNINATIWPYSHHVYYISEQTYKVNNQDLTVPVLKRKRLVSNKMVSETMMEGVENMRFVFGLDTNSDSRVDTYKSVEKITSSEWENRKGILTVQIFLLIRSLQPDANLKINNQTYTLGQGEAARTLVFNDKFRRTVFTTTIRLSNVGGNLWRI